MKKILLAASITLAFVLSGCAAKGEQFTRFEKPAGNEAVIYIYRPYLFFVNSGAQYNVIIRTQKPETDRVVGFMRNGGFLETKVEGGQEVKILSDPPTKIPATFYAETGKIYCVKAGFFNGGFTGYPRFKFIEDMDLCEYEIKHTKFSY